MPTSWSGHSQIVCPVVPCRGFRGVDDFGAGGYGAPRRKSCPNCGGKRCDVCEQRGFVRYPHAGLDLRTQPLDRIVAPHAGRIVHVGIAYPNADLGSLHLHGESFRSRLLYVRIASNLSRGMEVEQGGLFGSAQDVASFHEARSSGKRMVNHVHLDLWIRKEEAWVRVDPAAYLAATGMA